MANVIQRKCKIMCFGCNYFSMKSCFIVDCIITQTSPQTKGDYITKSKIYTSIKYPDHNTTLHFKML